MPGPAPGFGFHDLRFGSLLLRRSIKLSFAAQFHQQCRLGLALPDNLGLKLLALPELGRDDAIALGAVALLAGQRLGLILSQQAGVLTGDPVP